MFTIILYMTKNKIKIKGLQTMIMWDLSQGTRLVQYLHITQCDNKLKNKNHMIISIPGEKAFDKMQHSFMIKTLNQVGIEPYMISPQLAWTPGIGNGNPLQYSYQENSMDRGAWWTTVHAVVKSDMTEHNTTYSTVKS